MKERFLQFLPGLTGTPPAGGQEWSFGHTGLAPGWAFFLFLLLSAAVTWVYLRPVAGPAWGWRLLLIILRAASIAVLLTLLVRPVVNLTVNESVRQSLLVLLDRSQSMALADRRETPDDLRRAALAVGLADPHSSGPPSPEVAASVRSLSRWDLLAKLAANERLSLWPRLAAKSDLLFYGFGREAAFVGKLEPDGPSGVTCGQAARLFAELRADEPATAIGESLRTVLSETGGHPLAGVFLITDGGNNSGLPPVEAARIATDAHVPLFIYGVGITTPADLVVRDVDAPQIAFVHEQAEVHARLQSQGITGKTVTASLQAGGRTVDTRTVTLDHEGDYDLPFRFEPAETGSVKLEVSVPALPEESSADNNAAAATLRVIDTKVNVLLIEQEPRWEFRYLLAYLERDRRLGVRAVMINGEPDLDKYKDSPFLPGLPTDRDGIFRNQVIVLGDVNPADLGEARMNLIREWVDSGGGLIFIAGTRFDPSAYAGTPLAALLPVVPAPDPAGGNAGGDRAPNLVPLKLTASGAASPYLRLTPDPAANRQLWDGFPGVRWTAPLARAKPGADVLLVDPRPARAGESGPGAVFAVQSYGAGTCVYLGTDETYRWRSHVGEKFYSAFWGQIMQSLALQKLQDASSLVQLKVNKPQAIVGDKIVISGKVYRPGFKPLTVPTLEGTVTLDQTDAAGRKVSRTMPLNLSSTSGQGDYSGDFVVRAPGEYRFSTREDAGAVLKFAAAEPQLERLQTGLNERLLQAMADAAHGRYLREENLDELPDLVAQKSSTLPVFRQINLYDSPWWLAALLTPLLLEWLLRRLSQLK